MDRHAGHPPNSGPVGRVTGVKQGRDDQPAPSSGGQRRPAAAAVSAASPPDGRGEIDQAELAARSTNTPYAGGYPVHLTPLASHQPTRRPAMIVPITVDTRTAPIIGRRPREKEGFGRFGSRALPPASSCQVSPGGPIGPVTSRRPKKDTVPRAVHRVV